MSTIDFYSLKGSAVFSLHMVCLVIVTEIFPALMLLLSGRVDEVFWKSVMFR